VSGDVVPTSLRRDLDEAARCGLRATVVEAAPITGGRSAMTVRAVLDVGGTRRTVAVRAVRKGTDGLSLASLPDQYLLLEQLNAAKLPVPEPLGLADGAEYQLLITSFVEGVVPQPWRSSGRVELARLRRDEYFVAEFVSTLAAIHAVTAESLPASLRPDADDPARGYVGRSPQRSSAFIAGSTVFRNDPVLTYTGLWLHTHRPAASFAGGLVHGDYRMGNIVVRDDRIVGVLDWELAAAGEVLSDVAWLCGPQGSTDGLPAGLVGEEELVERYSAVCARAVDPDLFRFLKVEGTYRTSAVWAQLSTDEQQRSNRAAAWRCRDSVIAMIGLCAEVLGLTAAPNRDAGQVARGLGLMISDVLNEASTEFATLPEIGPATRNMQLLLRRLATMADDGSWLTYTSACTDFARQHGVEPGDLRDAPGALLSKTLRNLVASDAAASLDDSDTTRLVGWSAGMPIAMRNLLAATAGPPMPGESTVREACPSESSNATTASGSIGC
jgi:aminoglycoside phosphotransferase (APT) family kinase protein